jgi:hypothetical protein
VRLTTLIVRQSQPVRLGALIAVLAQVFAGHGDLSVITEGMTAGTVEHATLQTRLSSVALHKA